MTLYFQVDLNIKFKLFTHERRHVLANLIVSKLPEPVLKSC